MSVGERSAASIELGTESLLSPGDVGLEGGLGLNERRAASMVAGGPLVLEAGGDSFEGDGGVDLIAGVCWLEAEVRLTLAAGTPATGAADVSAVVVTLVGSLTWLP